MASWRITFGGHMATVNYSAICREISDNPASRVDLFERTQKIDEEKVLKTKTAYITTSVTQQAESFFTRSNEQEYVSVNLSDLSTHHLLVEHCINNKFSFFLNTSCLKAHIFTICKTLKMNDYKIKAIFISDDVPGVAKFFLNSCFPFADEVHFYDREGDNLRLGYKWKRHSEQNGSGEMHHFATFTKIVNKFNESLKMDGRPETWTSIFQKFPHSIEFMDGAGRP